MFAPMREGVRVNRDHLPLTRRGTVSVEYDVSPATSREKASDGALHDTPHGCGREGIPTFLDV